MAWTLWITGLPGSGKSTIAGALSEILKGEGIRFDVLRMDELRRIVTPEPTYSEEEREIVYAALVYTALMLNRNDVNVVIDATGNRRRYREKARGLISEFMEVYVKCPIELCMEREGRRRRRWGAPEAIYDKAFKGVSGTVPGLGVPYEEPLNPEVTVDSSRLKPSESAHVIYQAMKDKLYRGGYDS
ncbi:MAG: adenylyl-sulfate kinase [Candidatus Bathyarchaeia archaeon]